MTKRQQRIVRRMCEGASYYTNLSPRITQKDIAEIERMVGPLQLERIHGAEPGSPIAVYPLNKTKFCESAEMHK